MGKLRELVVGLGLVGVLGCSGGMRFDRLIISYGNRNYRVRKNEEEGVEDIRKLIGESEGVKNYDEESWVHLPKKRLWIEIGKNGNHKKRPDYGSELKIDFDFLHSLNHDDIIVYHFQSGYEGPLFINISEEEGLDLPRLTAKDEKCGLKAAIPSDSDIDNMAINSIVFYKSRPRGKISYKICSKFGITEFYLTQKGKRVLRGLDEFGRCMFLRELEQQRHNFLYEWKVSDMDVEDFDEAMSDDWIRVKFVPYEK